MKIFISWSGQVSREVALVMRELVGDVIQRTKPFMSEADIEAGDVWLECLNLELAETAFGIICLTAENLTNPWLHFEAGAVAKAVGKTRVCPCLFNLSRTDVKYPLAQFQSHLADYNGVLAILRAINLGSSEPLETQRLIRILDKHWPDAEAKLKAIAPLPPPKRPDEIDLLQEILMHLRSKPLSQSQAGAVHTRSTRRGPLRQISDKFERLIRKATDQRRYGQAVAILANIAVELRDLSEDEAYSDLSGELQVLADRMISLSNAPESDAFWNDCTSLIVPLLRLRVPR